MYSTDCKESNPILRTISNLSMEGWTIRQIAFSSAGRDWLIENVNYVFHSATTVKFYELLEVTTKINIQGTENVLAFVAQFRNLKLRIIEVSNIIGKQRKCYLEKYV